MIILVLLAQMISPPEPPPWPPRYTVRPGTSVTIRFAPASCNAAPILMLGKRRYCQRNNTIRVYIPRRCRLGTRVITERHGYIIGHLEIVSGRYFPRRRLW